MKRGSVPALRYLGARASCPQRACNCGSKGGQDARAPGYLFLALAIIALATCHQAMAQSQTLWQIGKFDRSSAEFNQKWEERALPGAALARNPGGLHGWEKRPAE